MRITQAARYARWSAWTAALLACGVGGVYVRRVLQERQERRFVPPRVPSAVEEQAAGFAFSKVEGDKTLYTVRASRATQFHNGSRVLLEDVSVTMYGPDGGRFDNMRTRSCDYVTATEMMTCGGEVQIDLAGADSAPRPKDPNAAGVTPEHDGAPSVGRATMHIQTSHLSFNHGTGMATTDQAVEMRFPQGEGRAVGAEYNPDQGQWRLLHDVEFTLKAAGTPGARGPAAPGSASDAPVKLSSSSLSYRGDERVLHMLGPVHVVQSAGGGVRQGAWELTSGKLDVDLDNESRARKVVASDHPLIRETPSAKENRGAMSVSADEFAMVLSSSGWIETASATGNVHADAKEAARETHVDAGRVNVEFSGSTNQPRQGTASGKVMAVSKGIAGATARLETSSLDLTFAPERKGSRIARATTPSATMDWQDKISGAGATERVHITGQQFEADFLPVNAGAHSSSSGKANGSTLSELRGRGGVTVERKIGAEAPQTSTSQEALARFEAGGEWVSVDQTGDVRLREGEQSAQSDRAHFDRANNSVTLTGSLEVTDSSSRTTATAGTFRHSANEFRADGPVVTSDLASSSSRLTNLGSGPAHVLADHLQLNTTTGHAVYAGHARLWQGDALVQAEVIELDRASQLLTADERVRAVFPQTARSPTGSVSAGSAHAGPLEFWHVEAGHMTYASRESRGHLDHNVHANSNQGTIAADEMDLFFAPQEEAQSGQHEAPRGQQLIRATAAGNVQVKQSDRQGTAARANYEAAEGKFELSGAPRVRDGSGNSTTGRQLTLFFDDDRILIDSEAGSRTLTLHRVEK